MEFSRRSAPHLPLPPQERRQGRDLIIAHPTGREFPKGEGAHALSLWTLQGDGIFKGRGKFGIPLPLSGVFGYFCRCWQTQPRREAAKRRGFRACGAGTRIAAPV